MRTQTTRYYVSARLSLVIFLSGLVLSLGSCGGDPCQGEDPGTIVCQDCYDSLCTVRCQTC